MDRLAVCLVAVPFLLGCATVRPASDPASLREQVMATERAFARTMAERDSVAFASFLSEEAIFYSGERALRGKAAVLAEWRPFFREASAPFSWDPDHVEVLESGTLALSSGPVLDADSRLVGRFNSIWRREPSGEWRVVFDKGSPVCPPPARPDG